MIKSQYEIIPKFRTLNSGLGSLFLIFSSLSLCLWACDDADGDDPSGGGDSAGMMAGSGGGDSAGMMTTIDDRCPDARAGVQFLVLFSDRVEAFKQDEVGFKVSRSCTFIQHSEQGVAEGVAMAVSPQGNFLILAPEGEAGGSVYVYSNNGEFIGKQGPNINLKDASRIWTINDGFIVWIQRTGSLYQLDRDGVFVGPYTPPQANSTRLQNLTDIEYIEEDPEDGHRLLALFSDQPPKLFAFPNSPELSRIPSAQAVSTIVTQTGKKLLISGQVSGEMKGVALFRQVNSGRMAPAFENNLVYDSDPEYGDGRDIASFEDGFYILDSGGDGARASSLNSFNTSGVPQEQSPLGVEGIPLEMARVTIFSDF